MKNILIPTDFSANSQTAINYGAELAVRMKAEITLLHAFEVPIFADQVYFEMETVEKWEKDFIKTLQNISEQLKSKYPDLVVKTEARFGQASDIIRGHSSGYDLIIMGSKGNGNIGDAIIGNVTLDVIRQARIAVLVVPPEVVYKPVNSIVLACNHEEVISDRVVSDITEFVKLNNAGLSLLNIVTEFAGPVNEAYKVIEKIKSRFISLSPSLNVLSADKVVDGINEFSDQINADLIVLVPDKHNFFERLFTEIHTRHMVKITHRALLIIP